MSAPDWTREQRARAAADIFERAAAALRRGDNAGGILAAGQAFDLLVAIAPEPHCKIALGFFGIFGDDARAAVAAILAGGHPADSLAGRVLEMRAEVPYSGKLRHEGKVSACNVVLTLLGVPR